MEMSRPMLECHKSRLLLSSLVPHNNESKLLQTDAETTFMVSSLHYFVGFTIKTSRTLLWSRGWQKRIGPTFGSRCRPTLSKK